MESLPKIADIMTSDLVYYDPAIKERCEEFCERRNISYLPSYDQEQIMEYVEDGFTSKQAVPEGRQAIQYDEYIFSEDLREKFSEFQVIFVFKDDNLVGVVHFSDYNSKPVYTFLYQRIFELETKFRNLLIHHGIHTEIIDVENVQERPPLEETYLYQLFEAVENSDVDINLRYEEGKGYEINKLRRQVMHGKQFVENKDVMEKPLHFNQESFEEFFQRVMYLDKTFRMISNRLNMMDLQEQQN